MSVEILFPVGRLVAGHPMFPSPVTDNDDKPVLDAAGAPVTERYIGVAIAKGAEQHWNQTVWGAQIWGAAQDPVNGYPDGEIGSPSFSWKIVDGDSTVPNKNKKRPCDQEGYARCWVIHMSTRIVYPCYHVGKYDPVQAIQNKDDIKKGYKCRVFAMVKGNKPSKSPGVYINPSLFEMTAIDTEIVSVGTGPSAADVFGGGQVSTPAPVVNTPPPVVPVVTAPVATPPPAHDLVTPPPVVAPVVQKFEYNGNTLTKTEWLAMPGWTEAMVDQHCKLVA